MISEMLHKFLCEKTDFLTEQWYERLDKNKNGIYGSQNPEIIEQLKEQNNEFHVRFCTIFEKSDEETLKEFQDWIYKIAKDEGHLNTPLSDILEEFFVTEKQYLELIKEFAETHQDSISLAEFSEISYKITSTINDIVLEFSRQNTLASEQRLNAQQELITEMSAPVIRLGETIGLLPLIGEINTHRAQVIFEKALEQSAENKIETLFIDLSGVPIIDTMVAHQIFQLIKGLKLIGVSTALSGISPNIAQTSVQLGLDFSDIKVYNTLTQAIELQETKVF
ncbi:STAS domain-containing protein [Planococcus sp. CAU13]|uniref:STAS domain-containing protein n=1 Tax=Planococcus sp. CAU13 TaxID=1541197 RepID=UPI00052FF193|nr:STAS domain-containing protein [Planococcus sp. CAU13]